MSPLSPESWKSIGPHLDRALDMSEEARRDWLTSLDEEDPATAAQLRDLLDEHRAVALEHFLEHRPSGLPAPPAGEGVTIGSYKLLRAIGEGGMGTVWLAERNDGELQQMVAIKLLLAGADRPTLRDRFLKERQFLANLNHPSIARLLDAGHTGDGRPYLIMEYVDGVPIDVYAAPLDLRDQLTLFLRVCDGVSHAHRRLIIHRDLKPSNILVDAGGQPKLLDFGIAKLLDESTDATQTIERALTPNYASPEQFRGQPQTIATDIYSLGAVLYKLLTGRSPHESGTGTSPVLSLITGGQQISPPSRMRAGIPKDIDYILGAALRAEPDERYVSVDAFADDLRAFLEWRPVKARSGDRWYRTRKLLRRHWFPVAAAAVMTAGLAVGLFVANRERTVAQRRFAQVRQVANRVLALDERLRGLPGSTAARQEIVALSKEYLEGLGREGRMDQDLTLEIASAYARLARAQGVPTTLNLGQYAQAEESLRKADALFDSVLAASPGNRIALLESAEVAQNRMILADTDRRRDEARAQAQKAVGRIDTLLGQGNASHSEMGKAAETYGNVSLMFKNQHSYQEAVRNSRRAMALAQAARLSPVVSLSISVMADAQRAMGDLDGAAQAITQARKLVESAEFPDEHARWADLFNVLWREGMIRGSRTGPSLGQTEEAIATFQRAFDLIEAAARGDATDSASRMRFAMTGRELGGILRDRDPGRALAVYDQAIARLGEVEKNNKARRGEAELLAGSSYALRKLKRLDEAKERIEKAFALLRDTKDYPAPRINLEEESAAALRALADYHADMGQPRRASEIYQELLDTVLAAKPDPLNDLRHAAGLSSIYTALASLHSRNGQTGKASELSVRRLQLWDHWNRNLPQSRYVLQQLAAARIP